MYHKNPVPATAYLPPAQLRALVGILDLYARDRRVTVRALARRLGVRPNAVSTQLLRLRDHGLISYEKTEGRHHPDKKAATIVPRCRLTLV